MPQRRREEGGAVSLKLLIVGYGKMGRMVEEMAAGPDFEIVGRVDDGRDEWRPAEVAVDFSTASALLANFPKYMQSKMNVVIGTTGWGEHTAKLRADAAKPVSASSPRRTFLSA
jgi:4-hydroxy-tetrahydrodipicolinate reductase